MYTKSQLLEKLNLYIFETDDVGGDILDISISPNRYSDAASHLGIAREVSAVMSTKLADPTVKALKPDVRQRGMFTVNIKDKKLCRRYMATYVSNIKVGPSPVWMKEVLESCGLRSINNVVDIMNYVMLEVGQPLHAFDADKVNGGIIVRPAKKGEKIETIDEQKISLMPDNLVIADSDSALAVAGIKGGKFSEVKNSTKHILVEAANFDGVSIYQSSRKLGLITDSSVRFSHQLSPELSELGMKRALQLLREIAGAKVYKTADVYPKKQPRKLLKVDIKKIDSMIGRQFAAKEVFQTLQSLGFKKVGSRVEVPALRSDINNIEDLAEEVARIYGFDNLTAQAPTVSMGFAQEEEQVTLKDRVRSLLTGAGISEVYNYSFLSKEEVGEGAQEILNPISGQFSHLRDSLAPNLFKNLRDNLRFFDAVRIFEIGKVFSVRDGSLNERLMLGVGIAAKDSPLELKGLADMIFGNLGITDYRAADEGGGLRFEIGTKVVGRLAISQDPKDASVLELDLGELLGAELEDREFKAIPKYPAVVRDISLFVPQKARVGDILSLIQRTSLKLVRDVDLLDYYEAPPAKHTTLERGARPDARRKSLTFRIVFQAEDRTLKDSEVDKEMSVITKTLIDKLNVELR